MWNARCSFISFCTYFSGKGEIWLFLHSLFLNDKKFGLNLGENGHLNTKLCQICQKKYQLFIKPNKSQTFIDLAVIKILLVNLFLPSNLCYCSRHLKRRHFENKTKFTKSPNRYSSLIPNWFHLFFSFVRVFDLPSSSCLILLILFSFVTFTD